MLPTEKVVMQKKPNPRNAGHAVRIGDAAFRELERLQKLVVARGWQVVGSANPRQPTLSAMVETAVSALSDREVS
jgi:hypothetical protein